MHFAVSFLGQQLCLLGIFSTSKNIKFDMVKGNCFIVISNVLTDRIPESLMFMDKM